MSNNSPIVVPLEQLVVVHDLGLVRSQGELKRVVLRPLQVAPLEDVRPRRARHVRALKTKVGRTVDELLEHTYRHFEDGPITKGQRNAQSSSWQRLQFTRIAAQQKENAVIASKIEKTATNEFSEVSYYNGAPVKFLRSPTCFKIGSTEISTQIAYLFAMLSKFQNWSESTKSSTGGNKNAMRDVT